MKGSKEGYGCLVRCLECDVKDWILRGGGGGGGSDNRGGVL